MSHKQPDTGQRQLTMQQMHLLARKATSKPTKRKEKKNSADLQTHMDTLSTGHRSPVFFAHMSDRWDAGYSPTLVMRLAKRQR